MIALKVKESVGTSKTLKTIEKSEELDTSDDSSKDKEISIDDEISLISKDLKILWRRRRRGDKIYKYKGKSRSFDKDKKSKNEIICFKCKKPGYMKAECPNLKKEKKKFQKKRKRIGLLSTWDDLDSSSSDEKETSEEAYIALMAKTDNNLDNKYEVRKELSELEEAYENLLIDSKVLITHYSE